MGEVGGHARPGLPRQGEQRVGVEGDEVEGTQPDAQLDLVPAGADGGDDVAQQAGAVLEGAAVFARAA